MFPEHNQLLQILLVYFDPGTYQEELLSNHTD